MTVVTLILKNGFKLSGDIISDDLEYLILQEKKLGRSVINKSAIAVRCQDSRGVSE
jgi:sRNA-binding regulator protein Hfq